MRNFLLMIACFILTANVSFPGTLKAYNYPEISMEAPASLNVKKDVFKDNLPTAGCCYIRPKAIAALVLDGKFPDRPSLRDSMIKLCGVPIDRWKLNDQPRGKAKGWVWREDYQTFIGDKLVYAALGCGAKRSYLIVLYTDKTDFTANQGDYQAWINSLRVN